ncbi:MAG TPA: formate dehydrogenase accessory sulfurtransferase FdhD, partial [Gammaproteobacteria bacterium]|nr:formate dehydrogenase accessory sulfurtransferase FdhD [Gammaproteobacteria bacterium]
RLAEDDVVATEEPLEIRLGYTDAGGKRAERSISVTMRTPGKDQELAVGFLYTEGIVRGRNDIASVGPCGPPAPNGLVNVVRVELAADVAADVERLERHFYTSSSCGVCGKSSIEAVAVQSRYDLRAIGPKVEASVLGGLPEALKAQQAVFEQTGGLHASGLFDAEGRILLVREDVGRHNALDKLIGNRLMADALPLEHFGIVVSGRASFELVQKAMMAGCAFLAAVGAPSSLAVELAAEFGMTLVGFLKRDRFNIYSGAERVL